MREAIEISAVIPTRNRPENLHRLLHCLSHQKQPLKEVIIIDSSDIPANGPDLSEKYPSLTIKHQVSVASVCIQRNIGIKGAVSPYIFLCDDDIEVQSGYIERISAHIFENTSVELVSGLIKEKNSSGHWLSQFPPKTSDLYKALIFQHSLWSDLSAIRYTVLNCIPLFFFKTIRKAKNGLSSAGWPRLIDFSSPVFKTKVYGLGASVGKKEFLLNYPFDEVLDPYGIGDNYLLAMNASAIHVLTGIGALHHKSDENRLMKNTSYFRRVLALHYALCTNKKFTFFNQCMLVWSLLGNVLIHAFKRDAERVKINRKLIRLILSGKNPYLLGKRNNLRTVIPEY